MRCVSNRWYADYPSFPVAFHSKPLADEILNTNEEVEVMIESYLMDYNTLSTKLEYLRAQIQNAEDLVSE